MKRKPSKINASSEKHESLTWQEVPCKGSTTCYQKELEPSHSASEAVILGMESVEVCRDDEVTRPDHGRRPDHESTADPGERKARQLGREHEKDAEADAEIMTVPQLARDCHVERVGRTDGSIGHDDDERVLFDVEWTRVETKTGTTEPHWNAEVPDRKKIGQSFAAWIHDDSTPVSAKSNQDLPDAL